MKVNYLLFQSNRFSPRISSAMRNSTASSKELPFSSLESDDAQIVVWKTCHLSFITRITPPMLNDIVALVRIPPLTSTIHFGALVIQGHLK